MWESDPDAMQQELLVNRIEGPDRKAKRDCVVVEEPLEIRLNNAPLAVTMRTPGQDDALAAGFLLSEGILRRRDDLYDITRCADATDPDARNIVNVVTSAEVAQARDSRQLYATSSCGLCGRATIEAIRSTFPPIAAPPAIFATLLATLMDRLRRGQRTFERTGGLHAAGLFDPEDGEMLVEEDVGRHNAVDKVIGRAFLSDRWPLDRTTLAVSGRAGFEIVQKALAARIPAVCSVSAPSSMAVELARESGMVLVGFLRGETMNVYSGEEYVD